MRTYVGHNPQAIQDVATRNAVLALHDQMLQLNGGVPNAAAYPTGTVVVRGSGGGGGGVTDHGALTGLADDDHTQYLLLAGRSPGQVLQSISTTQIPFTVRGIASQNTNLQEWQTSTGIRLAYVSKEGRFVSRNSAESSTASLNADLLTVSLTNTGGATMSLTPTGVTFRNSSLPQASTVVGDSSLVLKTHAASVQATLDSTVDGQLLLTTTVPGKVLSVFRGAAAHSTNLQEWQNSSSSILAKVTNTGVIGCAGLGLNGSSSGTATIVAAAVTTNHTMTLPANNASGALMNNGSGTLSWAAPTAAPHNLLDGSIHADTVYPGALARGMMTWVDSSVNWGGFVVGAANTTLTSDGTDPGWRTLNNAHIDNRTRYLWIHTPSAYIGAAGNFHLTPGSAPNAAQSHAFSGTADTYMYVNFMVPVDYVSGLVYKLYFLQRGATSANNIIWYAYQLRVVVGTTKGLDAYGQLDKATYATSGGADTIVTKDITSTLGSVAAGDMIRLTLARLALSDASDNNTNTVDLLGIRLEYTADM